MIRSKNNILYVLKHISESLNTMLKLKLNMMRKLPHLNKTINLLKLT